MRRKLFFTFALLLTAVTGAWADDIVITNANFTDYFEYNSDFEYRKATESSNETGGYFLKDAVETGVTLDFQGTFLSTLVGENKPRIFINKRVNIKSSTENAVFQSVDTKYWTFGVLQGADQTVVKNLQFDNCWVFVDGSEYVTFDGISHSVHDVRLGPGVGNFSVYCTNVEHQSRHATIKNSHFTCSNNGGSSVVVITCGGAYATVDNNTIECSGNVGNILYASIYNSNGDDPNFSTFTNNVITKPGTSSAICWGLIPCSKGGLIENNTVNYAGAAMNTAFGAPADAEYPNTYRNNIINGGTMSVYAYSVVENNQVSGALTIPQGVTATNNTVGRLIISGNEAIVKNNTIYSDISINKNNTTFTGNVVTGTFTLSNSNNTKQNIITGNAIISTGDYAVVVNNKATNNTIENNLLISSSLQGDAAVSPGTGAGNSIQNNVGGTVFDDNTEAMTFGDDPGTFYIVTGECSNNKTINVTETGQCLNIVVTKNGNMDFGGYLNARGRKTGIFIIGDGTNQGTLNMNGLNYSDLTIRGGQVTINGDNFAPGYYKNIDEGDEYEKDEVVSDDITTATLTYVRPIPAGTDAWTVCLPYEPPTDDLTYYTLESVSGTTLNFTEIESPVPNTPYLVVATNNTNIGTEEPLVVDFNTEIENPAAVDGYQFKGTLRGLNHDDSEGKYILQGNNKWGIVDSDHENVYIPPFRAYIEVTEGDGARSLDSNFSDDTTAIDRIHTINKDGTEQWFDLSGRRIAQPTKGIYIHNGKKVIRR